MRIAIVQYEIEALPQWNSYENKIVRFIEEAKQNKAELVTFGEYAGLEAASWMQHEQFDYLQSLLSAYQQLFTTLATRHQIYIQPGTIPVKESDGFYRNRAYFFSPDGKMAYQDKIFLTPFEKATGLIKPGTGLNLFSTSIGKIGIVTCYDCEFPPLAQQLVTAGATLLLSPCCTERITGLTRVSICARARAIENQCYVAQASLIGKGSWSDFIDICTGQSGIYTPADTGFPENGILALAALNTPMFIYADLQTEKLLQTRHKGETLNHHDHHEASYPLPFQEISL